MTLVLYMIIISINNKKDKTSKFNYPAPIHLADYILKEPQRNYLFILLTFMFTIFYFTISVGFILHLISLKRFCFEFPFILIYFLIHFFHDWEFFFISFLVLMFPCFFFYCSFSNIFYLIFF